MLTALLASLLAAGASAVVSDPNAAALQNDISNEEIVVEGMRDRRRDLDRFVDALTNTPIDGQISRFDWAVCPAVVGLSDAHSDAIVKRMRAVAAATGIRTADTQCRPNVLVLVANNKRDLIEQMSLKMPAYFTGLSGDQVRSLARGSSPAAAWHVEGKLNRDGIAVSRDLVNDHYVVEMSDAPSRLQAASRPHFVASILVVELQSLAGFTATQLADYAAMRTFARTDPERLKNSSANSILRIFDTPEDVPVPITMTDWDFNFLKALYTMDPNAYASQQRGSIRRSVREQVSRPQPE